MASASHLNLWVLNSRGLCVNLKKWNRIIKWNRFWIVNISMNWAYVSDVFLVSTGLSAKVKKDETGQNVDHGEPHRQVRKEFTT